MKEHLPKDWKLVKLGEVCKLKNGFAFKSSEYQNEGIPVLRISDIKLGNVTPEKSVRVNEQKVFDDYIVKTNEILVAMSGATTGKFGIYKSSEKAYQNQRVGKFKILDERKLDNNFLLYQLHALKRQIEKDAYGGAQPNISSGKIEAMEIPLPPKPTQLAIVSKIEELFSELDKGIESLCTAQKQLKTYRQSVLKWAFEGKLSELGLKGFQDDKIKISEKDSDDKILKSSNLKNPNSDKGELPKGWRWVKISEIAHINPKLPNKESINENLEVQFLPMKLVEEIINKFHLIETRTFKELQNKSYTPFINGDIIFAKVTPCMENGKIAVVENLKNGIGYGSSEFHVLRCSKDALNKYLFYFLVQDRFRNEAQNAMTGAVGLRRVPKQFIENHSIPLSRLEEQNIIVQAIESRLSVADKMEESINQSLKQAEALKQSILKKAFEGKLVC